MSGPARLLAVAESAERGPDADAFAAVVAAWAARHPGAVQVVFLRGGPLAAELREVVPVAVNAELPAGGVMGRLDGLAYRVGLRRLWGRIRRRRLGGLDVTSVYLDSARVVQALRYLGLPHRPPGTVRVVARVVPDPDLDQVRKEDRDLLARCADVVMCGSDAAAAVAGARLGLRPEQVRVVPEVVVAHGRGSGTPVDGRTEGGAVPPGGGARILGVGPVTYRRDARSEGRDLFVRLAGVLARRHPGRTWQVAWLSRPDEDPMRFLADHDLRAAGVAQELEVVGPPDLEHARAADVLVVTARPGGVQPLVVDAVRAGLPVVAFEGVDGMPSTHLAPFLDMEAMADLIAARAPGGDPGLGVSPPAGADVPPVVVGAAARAGWTGGGEQLVPVARALVRQAAGRAVQLRIAEEPDPRTAGWLARDVELAGLEEVVRIVPWAEAPAVVTGADVVLCTARRAELTGPLLEAAGAGVPLVVTAGSPLALQVAADGAGVVVPPLDPAAMAAAALDVATAPARRGALAAAARHGVGHRHAPEAVAPLVWDLATGAAP